MIVETDTLAGVDDDDDDDAAADELLLLLLLLLLPEELEIGDEEFADRELAMAESGVEPLRFDDEAIDDVDDVDESGASEFCSELTAATAAKAIG